MNLAIKSEFALVLEDNYHRVLMMKLNVNKNGIIMTDEERVVD